MSTRCQVKVTGTDFNNSPDISLYHHCDGYPSYMLPLIGQAYIDCWQAGRVGKAAAMLCANDPTGYEIEQGNDLRGDIEYYYVVNVTKGQWEITAFRVPFNQESRICDLDKIGVFNVADAANYKEETECGR